MPKSKGRCISISFYGKSIPLTNLSYRCIINSVIDIIIYMKTEQQMAVAATDLQNVGKIVVMKVVSLSLFVIN